MPLSFPSLRRSRFAVIVAGLCGVISLGSPTAQGQAVAPVAALKPVPQIEDFAPPNEFVMAGAVKTHYLVAGDPAGQPIIFLHGFASCTYSWRLNMPALAIPAPD